MTTTEMIDKVHELRELKRMMAELEAEIEAVTDDIKAEMIAQDVETLAGTDWKVTYKSVTTSRLDATALKKTLPDIAAQFMRQTTTKRFLLA